MSQSKTIEEQNLETIADDMRRAWEQARARQEAFTTDTNGEPVEELSPEQVQELEFRTLVSYAAYMEALELLENARKRKETNRD